MKLRVVISKRKMLLAGVLVVLALGVSGAAAQDAPEDVVILRNSNGMEVHIVPVGAAIQRLLMPDRNGELADIVLGFDDLEPYEDGSAMYMGILGRVANRIDGAQFTLDGVTYKLYPNDGNDTLHGGKIGFDRVWWTMEETWQTANTSNVLFSYNSWDGEEGFPGNVNVTLQYTLTNDNELLTDFFATTDKATPINVVQHAYWNLAGHNSNTTILDHLMMINADYYTPIEDGRIMPTGEIAPVNGTVFDFRTPHAVGERIAELVDVPIGGNLGGTLGGYDHNWVLFGLGPDAKDQVVDFKASEEPQLAVTLVDPESGRGMEVWTTAPGLQFYSGNFLDGSLVGKGGTVYNRWGGLSLETQMFPNSVNEPNFPSTILRPGQLYEKHVVYKFSTNGAAPRP